MLSGYNQTMVDGRARRDGMSGGQDGMGGRSEEPFCPSASPFKISQRATRTWRGPPGPRTKNNIAGCSAILISSCAAPTRDQLLVLLVLHEIFLVLLIKIASGRRAC